MQNSKPHVQRFPKKGGETSDLLINLNCMSHMLLDYWTKTDDCLSF